MPFPTTFANQFSCQFVLTTAGVGFAFGFVATAVQILNDGGVPVKFNLKSTSPASSGDFTIKGQEQFFEWVPPTSGAGFFTTSTGHQPSLRIAAWG